MSWEKRPGEELGMIALDDQLAHCVATPLYDDVGDPTGIELCESRPDPLDAWSTWTVVVGLDRPGPASELAPSHQPVDFTVNLTIENVGPDGLWGDIKRATAGPGSWAPPGEARIQPGVKSRTNSQCTLNVLFESPDDDAVYAGSAAHCHAGKAIGAMVEIGGIPNAGRLVYCAWGTEATNQGQAPCPDWDGRWNHTKENDFSLVEIKPALLDQVNPALPFWGGPTGMAEPVDPGERLMIYGNSTLRDGGRDRAPSPLDPLRGLALDQTNRTVVMQAPGAIFGDSGGPALDAEGRALGIASYLATPPETKQAPAEIWYASLPWTVSFMEAHTSLDVDLLTAPLAEPVDAPVETVH